MHRDAVVARVRAAVDRNMDCPAALVYEPPKSGCTVVAQCGALATGQDRGHPLPVAGQLASPDRIDAAMNRVQAAFRDPVLHGFEGEADREQLKQGDYAVLGRGDLP